MLARQPAINIVTAWASRSLALGAAEQPTGLCRRASWHDAELLHVRQDVPKIPARWATTHA